MEQIAHRGDGYCMPEDINGQYRWGSEQHDLAVDVPAHFRGVEIDDLEEPPPTQTML